MIRQVVVASDDQIVQVYACLNLCDFNSLGLNLKLHATERIGRSSVAELPHECHIRGRWNDETLCTISMCSAVTK